MIGKVQDILINNNRFAFNEASDSGAGIFISFAESATITNNHFGSNESKAVGGGAYIFGNEITVSNNSFNQNTSNRSGGGLYAKAAWSPIIVNISNNVFSYNVSDENGGGAYLSSPKLDISNNEFYENTSGINGGGAYVVAGELNMSDNIFMGNSTLSESDLGGGGVGITNTNDNSTTTLTNNIFNSNQSAGNGGGLGFKSRSGFSDNLITLTNNTYTMNTADLNGGGISINALQPPVVCPPDIFCPASIIIMLLDIYNNIVFGNSAGDNGEDIFIFEEGYNISDLTLNLFNNDFSDLFSNQLIVVGNNIDEDPLFVDAEAGDLSLLPDSPCIDAGDPNAPDVPDTDIFGNPRVPPPDMGAVEFIEEAIKGGGGCSIAHNPVTSSLAVFLALPVLILIRRVVKRYRSW